MTTQIDPRLHVVIYRDLIGNPGLYVLASRYMFYTPEGAFRMAAAASRSAPKKRAPLVVSTLESIWEDVRRDNPEYVAVAHEAPGGEGHAQLLGWGERVHALRLVAAAPYRKLVIATGPQGWARLVIPGGGDRDYLSVFDDESAFAPLEAAP